MKSLNHREIEVLKAVFAISLVSFAFRYKIAGFTGYEKEFISRACQKLKRRGLIRTGSWMGEWVATHKGMTEIGGRKNERAKAE